MKELEFQQLNDALAQKKISKKYATQKMQKITYVIGQKNVPIVLIVQNQEYDSKENIYYSSYHFMLENGIYVDVEKSEFELVRKNSEQDEYEIIKYEYRPIDERSE